MARNKGTFPFAANFEVKAASPLDPRVLVEKKSELISKDTWPLDGDTLYIYEGLLVSVQEERAIYMLVDPDKILETDYSGWERKDGNSSGEVSYEDIYIIEGLTAHDIEIYVEGPLRMDGRNLSEAIDSNKRVYIKYSNSAGAGIIPCSAYREDLYYVSFRLNSFLYGFDIGADSQYIDETSIWHIGIQEQLISEKNIKTINGQSILGEGNLKIEGLSSAIPDWNENNPSAVSYIKNRTHYLVEHKITEEFTLVGFLYNKCKYDEDTDGYYTTADIKIRYNEDDYEGTIIIQKGTLLGYDSFNDEVTITGEDQGEEFAFISYVENYNIYFKVSQPNYGTNFRLLEYVTLDEAYIPDTIARKSDLENIGGGGSVDSETIKEIKTTLESHEELIEDLQNMKIDKENDDYYPNMSVGTADNLAGQGEATPSEFTTRQSGGGAILDGTARIEAIKGNSVVWNQLLDTSEYVSHQNGIDVTKDDKNNFVVNGATGDSEAWIKCHKGVFTLVQGHKYLVTGCPKGGSGTTYSLAEGNGIIQPDFGDGRISECSRSIITVMYIVVRKNTTVANLKYCPLVYDLTKMFGVGNEPATVEEFNKRMPIEVNYALYNTGQMINLNPSGIKSYSADEEPIERFQDLSLIGTLFPDGMKSVGEFHDEIKYNKETQKWEKITRIGEVDLGSLDWSYTSSTGYFYSAPPKDIGGGNTFKETNKQVVLINSADFTGLHWSAFTDNYVSPRNNAISLFYTPDYDAVRANICCGAYTDVASFKEYLQGKKAYFVLNDPIVEELEFDGNLDYQVWNGGTEEVVPYDEPTTPLKADIVYGFNAYGKIKELENKIDNLGTGGGGNDGPSITVDSALSDTSTNPVQNKAIVAALATKTSEDDVNRLIALEHIYFLYKANENKMYFRGFSTQECTLVLPYVLNATFGKPLTPHLSITTNDGAIGISTNAFEIDVSNGEYKMTWSYNGKKFSLVFDESGEQIITSQDIDYATTQQLTELSAEVSQTYATKEFVEDALAKIPSGESSMFEATFGETPFADLWNAYQSNKHVVVRSGKFVLSLVHADETIISFSAINNENVYSATCNSSNVWTQGNVFNVEKATNKVQSLSDKSTIDQYPSAKAVYDFVNNTLGTLINGDY